MANTVYSSPRANITINSKVAGFVTNVQFQENFGRAQIQGLGNLTLQEVPAINYNGTFTVNQWFLDFKQPVLEEMLQRAGSIKQVVDTLVFGELNFNIDMYRGTIVSQDGTTKIVTEADYQGETVVSLGPCYVNTTQFQISDQGVAGYNVSGFFLNPITTIDL